MSKTIRLILCLVSALGLTALFVLIAPIQEAILASTQTIIRVDTLEDEDNDDGDCSLREAIRAANENDSVDACMQGVPITDTINFDISGTIKLTEQLSITAGGPLAIEGAEVITISGGDSVGIFIVETGARLWLNSLLLIDGYAGGGGAIHNHGTLTVNNSILSENNTHPIGYGGGIYNELEANLTINNSTITGNHSDTGGGIYNNGTLKANDLTLSNNHVDGMWGIGGGIFNGHDGILVVDRSSLSSNSAYYSGGGINNFGTLTVTNSTLADNSAGENGGGISNYGTALTVLNSTLSGNSADGEGGGIYSVDIVASIGGSILSNNSMGDNCAGDPIYDVGFNIEDADTCGFSVAKGSLPNTEPLLGPLQDSGGPTWTYALLYGSPAIDAADSPDCPLTDQRGVRRPVDGDGDGEAACDIGAYEYDQMITLVPAFQSASDAPGATLVYTFILSNSTDLVDTYALTLGGNAWETSLSTEEIGPLSADEAWPFTLSVSIPLEATSGMTDTVVITATSTTSPTIFWDSARVTSQVIVTVPKVYLPLVVFPPRGIYGYVTENSVPAGGIPLELRFFDSSSWSTLATTTTDPKGRYVFENVPDLGYHQAYYVSFRNLVENLNHLWVWGTQELISYHRGDSVNIGNFDIANIELLSPLNEEAVSLPYTFRWRPRPASPFDSYELNLFDPEDEDPYFWNDPPLGYVGSYTLTALPSGFSEETWYLWDMWVYSPDGGYGISYDARWVGFVSGELNSTLSLQALRPMIPPNWETPGKK